MMLIVGLAVGIVIGASVGIFPVVIEAGIVTAHCTQHRGGELCRGLQGLEAVSEEE